MRRRALSTGETEEDVLMSLHRMPQDPVSCTKTDLYQYYSKMIERMDEDWAAPAKEDDVRSETATDGDFLDTPPSAWPATERFLRNYLKAELLLGRGELKRLPDGEWVAVNYERGLLGHATTRNALLQIPGVKECESSHIFPLRSVIKHASKMVHGFIPANIDDLETFVRVSVCPQPHLPPTNTDLLFDTGSWYTWMRKQTLRGCTKSASAWVTVAGSVEPVERSTWTCYLEIDGRRLRIDVLKGDRILGRDVLQRFTFAGDLQAAPPVTLQAKAADHDDW